MVVFYSTIRDPIFQNYAKSYARSFKNYVSTSFLLRNGSLGFFKDDGEQARAMNILDDSFSLSLFLSLSLSRSLCEGESLVLAKSGKMLVRRQHAELVFGSYDNLLIWSHQRMNNKHEKMHIKQMCVLGYKLSVPRRAIIENTVSQLFYIKIRKYV